MNNIIWTIAGSDSSGGAGIQADIKAAHSFDVHACSVITALTAQNSMGVEEINATSIRVLESQLDALEQDRHAAVIKIGMLANEQQVEFIANTLKRYKTTWPNPPIVVYDPVAIASSGDQLTEEDILPVVKSELLPLVDVITPNTNETQLITGVYLIGPSAVDDAARVFMQLGVKAVIIKGGHWDYPKGYCVDYCQDSENMYWLASKTLHVPHSHGTGCTFASVVAANLSKQYPLKDAFILAKAYINQGLRLATRYGQGIGPVAHGGFPHTLSDYPEVVEADSWLGQELDLEPDSEQVSAREFARIETRNLGIYPVVDSLDWIERCLKAGIKTVQLRIKNAQDPDLEEQIATAVTLGEKYNARLFINDYWQLAIKYKAYGVHLGQEDLSVANLADIKAAGLKLGVSTHGFYEMLRAHNYRPSYLAFGAIYPTTTKDMTGQIQGLEKLRHFVPLMNEYPMVAIGGIDLERAESVAQTGVGSIAVVRAITEANDPEAAMAQLEQVLLC